MLILDVFVNMEIFLRAGGNILGMAKKLSLGSPVAGNFFLAEAK